MKRSVKILWRVFFGGVAAFLLLLLCANFGLFGSMLSVEELQNPEADLASEIYTRHRAWHRPGACACGAEWLRPGHIQPAIPGVASA